MSLMVSCTSSELIESYRKLNVIIYIDILLLQHGENKK